MSKRHFRTSLKILKVLTAILLAGITYLFAIKLARRSHSLPARAAWLKQQARRFLWALGVEPSYVGAPPPNGLLISNHISYVDILVHAAHTPLVFISKAEVAHWPVFGALSRWAGTLFIRRELRSDVLRVAAQMPPVIDAGVILAFFPEGTSSDGSGVLPFRASLLAPLVDNGWHVTPAFLQYDLEPGDGEVAEEVAYYRPETEFGPHLLNLLGKQRIRARLTYGIQEPCCGDRKMLATQLRGKVCALGGIVEEPTLLN
jgi:1-acyl-sn-glycerol-3-phosphate acyltransferase